MTITKQDTVEYNNSSTAEQEIIVDAEAVNTANSNVLVPAGPKMTTELVVATNTSESSTSEPETAQDEVPEPSSNVHEPNLAAMKRRRVRSQTAAGWVGGATGFILLGVPGAIVGGIAGNKITKHSMKRMETKAKADYEVRVAEERYTPMNHNEENLITRAVVA